MSERIEEIRERLGKATPGPWEVEAMDAGHSRYEMNVWITEKSAGDVVCDMDGLARSHNEKYDDDGHDDAAFIANAPADVAFLLAEVERLEREKAEAQARAWDKGYGRGREDGESWHVRVSGRLPHKQSPNPYKGRARA